MRIRKRLYEIMEVAAPGDNVSHAVDIFIMGLIILNVAAINLESIPSIYNEWKAQFALFELFSVLAFTIEYLIRLWCSVEKYSDKSSFSKRLKYMASPMAIIDFVAVVPFYLPFLGIDLRMARLFRLFRLFKLIRYSKTLQTIGRVFFNRQQELVILSLLMLMILLLASGIMYFAEHNAQPEAFSSIPASMWWAVATLTTVGYGDVYPVTSIGRTLASFIAILGIGMVALPAGILSSAFSDEMQKKRGEEAKCPYCGIDNDHNKAHNKAHNDAHDETLNENAFIYDISDKLFVIQGLGSSIRSTLQEKENGKTKSNELAHLEKAMSATVEAVRIVKERREQINSKS